MLALEIWLNGKRLFVAGHKDAMFLEAGVSFHRNNAEQFLSAHSILWREGQPATEGFWGAPYVGSGDEVLIRLVDTEKPTQPEGQVPFGMRLPPPWGPKNEECCSFCGAESADRKYMFDGMSVRICDVCIEFRHKIIADNAPKV